LTIRFPSLDGWRGVAILMVLFAHGASKAYLGQVGVRIFFCISGFLITYLLLEEERGAGRLNWKRFFARRALRIVPVYYAFLLFVGATNSWLHWGINWRNLFTSLTFTNGDWLRRYNTWPLAHTWSLAVEQQFYLFWPIFLSAITGMARQNAIVAALIALPLARVALVLIGYTFPLGLPFISNADYLLAGALAAILLPQLRSIVGSLGKGQARGMEVFSFALFGAIWLFLDKAPQLEINPTLVTCFEVGPGTTLMAVCIAIAMVSTVVSPSGLLAALLNSTPMVVLGLISYSVYMWQQLAFDPYNPNPAAWQRFPANIIIAIVAGALSYLLWERWFLRLKKKFAGPAPTPAAMS
jgi:peptidoglycan/LPS O-acetylase OafA/YrhL